MQVSNWLKQQVTDLATQIASVNDAKWSDKHPMYSCQIAHRDIKFRVQAIRPPASEAGTVLSFRLNRKARQAEPKKFAFLRDQKTSLEEERLDMLRSIQAKSYGQDVDEFLRTCVSEKLNVIVSGGTSTGKTELGRRLLWFVDDIERIATIEDAPELNPKQSNTITLVAEREDNSPRSAEKLLQATLRLRPDRIIVGELRGIEAATFLDSVNTGHEGSFTTLHATTARKAIKRLALLILNTGTRLEYPMLLELINASIDLVIQTGRVGSTRGILETYFPALETTECKN